MCKHDIDFYVPFLCLYILYTLYYFFSLLCSARCVLLWWLLVTDDFFFFFTFLGYLSLWSQCKFRIFKVIQYMQHWLNVLNDDLYIFITSPNPTTLISLVWHTKPTSTVYRCHATSCDEFLNLVTGLLTLIMNFFSQYM